MSKIMDLLTNAMKKAKDERPDPVEVFLNQSGIPQILADLEDDVITPDQAIEKLRDQFSGTSLASAKIAQFEQDVEQLTRQNATQQTQIADLNREKGDLQREKRAKEQEIDKLKDEITDLKKPAATPDKPKTSGVLSKIMPKAR